MWNNREIEDRKCLVRQMAHFWELASPVVPIEMALFRFIRLFLRSPILGYVHGRQWTSYFNDLHRIADVCGGLIHHGGVDKESSVSS